MQLRPERTIISASAEPTSVPGLLADLNARLTLCERAPDSLGEVNRGMANSMRFGCAKFRKPTDQPHLHMHMGHSWWHRALPAILLLAPTLLLIGCSGLVSAGGTKSQAAIQ